MGRRGPLLLPRNLSTENWKDSTEEIKNQNWIDSIENQKLLCSQLVIVIVIVDCCDFLVIPQLLKRSDDY